MSVSESDTRQADAPALTARQRKAQGGTKRPGRSPLLSGEDMVIAARLAAKGYTARAIARVLSLPERDGQNGKLPPVKVSPITVSKWLRRARQSGEELQMSLASLRMDAVESWGLAMRRGARDGRHAPAKDLLAATGVIAKDSTDRVVVILGTGDHRAPLPPAVPASLAAAIDVTPPATPPQLPVRVIADI